LNQFSSEGIVKEKDVYLNLAVPSFCFVMTKLLQQIKILDIFPKLYLVKNKKLCTAAQSYIF